MTARNVTMEQIQSTLTAMGEKAVSAARALAVMPPQAKVCCLNYMADEIEAARNDIFAAN